MLRLLRVLLLVVLGLLEGGLFGPGAPAGPSTLPSVARARSNPPVAPVQGTPTPPPTPLATLGCPALWQIAPPPAGPGDLRAVAALADNDVWAVGSTGAGINQTITIQHWDGSQWRAVPSPYPGPRPAALTSISARTPTDIWAVGYYTLFTWETPYPLIELGHAG